MFVVPFPANKSQANVLEQKKWLFAISPQFYGPNKRKEKKEKTRTTNVIKYFCPRIQFCDSHKSHYILSTHWDPQGGDIIDQKINL